MSVIKSFENAFKRMRDKNWDKIYVLVDIHDTIFEACYEKDENFKWFPYAQETLSLMSYSEQISLILWTSTYPSNIEKYVEEFNRCHIKFDFINMNSDAENTSLACFDDKMYFNVGLDDKFGFDANEDWNALYNYLTDAIRLGVFK